MQLVGTLLLLFGAGIFVLIYGMVLKARRNERLAQLYEKALDQGRDPREVQFALDEKEVGDPQGNLKAGLILLATALALALGTWAAAELEGAYKALGFVLVPAAIGGALLYIHFSVRHHK